MAEGFIFILINMCKLNSKDSELEYDNVDPTLKTIYYKGIFYIFIIYTCSREKQLNLNICQYALNDIF